MSNLLKVLISLSAKVSLKISRLLKRPTLIISTVFVLTACGSDEELSEDIVEVIPDVVIVETETETETEANDGIGPIITLVGESEINWTQDFDYEDFGADAYDDIDGVTPLIQTNDIDVSTVGSYTVTYSAVDLEDNETITKRTVNVVASTPFITTWTTTSENEEIKIRTNGSGYKYSIDWGDGGEVEINVTGDSSHIYDVAGTYTVTILGRFLYLYSSSYGTDRENNVKLTSVEQWGNTHWENMELSFYGATNLVVNATDTPILFNVSNMRSMFSNASSFNADISSWDVSNVTDMSYMFSDASSFNADISSWDVSNVTDMTSMFFLAEKFNQPLDNWDVSNVTDMTSMFFSAEKFNQPLDNWDVSNVTDMSSMFSGSDAFNQPLNNWDVSNVRDMKRMFSAAVSFNQPLNNWDVSSVIDMNAMFFYAPVFNQPLNNWDVSNVTNMQGMFSSALGFNQLLGDWDISNVTDMSNMLSAVGLSTESYSQLLDGWSLRTLQPSITFYIGAYYNSESAAAHQYIMDNYNWYILDDGELPETADSTGPSITMWDEGITTVSQYSDLKLSAYAVDDRDGAVAVTTSGSVNTSVLGVYTLTYTASDSAGNTSTATREITVE